MAWQPDPFVLKCEQCGWKKVYSPQSDALIEPFVEVCPKCGHRPLKRTVLDSKLGQWIGKLIGKRI